VRLYRCNLHVDGDSEQALQILEQAGFQTRPHHPGFEHSEDVGYTVLALYVYQFDDGAVVAFFIQEIIVMDPAWHLIFEDKLLDAFPERLCADEFPEPKASCCLRLEYCSPKSNSAPATSSREPVEASRFRAIRPASKLQNDRLKHKTVRGRLGVDVPPMRFWARTVLTVRFFTLLQTPWYPLG